MTGIKKKLVLLLGALVAVICIGLGMTSYITARKALMSNLEKTLPEISKVAGDGIQSKLEGELGKLESIAARSDISDPKIDAKTKQQLLLNEAKRLNSVDLDYIDTNYDIHKLDGSVINVKGSYVKKALEGISNVSDPRVRKDDNSITVFYAVPVKSGDKIIGVLLESRDANALSEYTDKVKFGNSGQAFLLNGEGTTIAHKNREKVTKQENVIEQSKKDPSLKVIADTYKKVINKSVGLEKFSYKGKDYFIGHSPIEGTDWSIGVIIYKTEILSELNILKITCVLMSLVFIILGIVFVWFIADALAKTVNGVSRHLEFLAKGDLSNNVPEKYLVMNNEIGHMAKSLRMMQDSLKGMVTNIKDSAESVSEHSENLSSISEEIAGSSQNVTEAISNVAQGTATQTENIINITEILDDFSKKLTNMVSDIDGVDENSKGIGDMASDSNKEMTELNKSVNNVSAMFKEFYNKIISLGKNINEINEITNLINDIAEQTNLLALNAAIEAARAGEAGKGFAVVAEEIRTLAEQSKTSSENISKLISGISKDTDVIVNDSVTMDTELMNQVKTIENSISSFVKIINGVDEIIPQIDKVKMSADSIEKNKNTIVEKIDELSAVSEEVSASSEEISASSEEMNASTEEVAASAQSLSGMTTDMMKEVNKFKI